MTEHPDIRVVNLNAMFNRFSDHWSPRIAGVLNGQHVKLAKVKGEFVWHHHADEDELFMVLQGHLTIDLRNQPPLEIGPGEFAIIPRGVEHRPRAAIETYILLLEPAGTLNTGTAEDSELTVDSPEWLV